MDRREQLRREMVVIFKAELDEHLETANGALLALEKGPSPEEAEKLLEQFLRVAHSSKGAARVVNLSEIERLFHAMEDVLSRMRGAQLSWEPAHFDVFFRALDLAKLLMDSYVDEGQGMPRGPLREVLDALALMAQGKTPNTDFTPVTSIKPAAADVKPANDTASAPNESPSIPPTPPSPATEEAPSLPKPPVSRQSQPPSPPSPAQRRVNAVGDDTIRMSTAKLDSLMAGVGQLLVSRMRIEHRLSDLRSMLSGFASWEKDWRRTRKHRNRIQRQSVSSSSVDALLAFLARNEEHLERTSNALGEMTRSFDADCAYLHLLTDDLQEVVRRIRMLPIGTLFARFPRMVRDIAHKQGKDVTLELEGEDTEVDRQVLELIGDPLTHLLRNAVGHGVESTVSRSSKGKPSRGVITLRAEQRGNSIVIEVRDDGAGINVDAVRDRAVESGLMTTEDAARLPQRAVLDLVFHSGLSTATEVSEISGRGVGLDVVRSNLERLGGQIVVSSSPGVGTTFTLILPLTMATSHVLLVEVAGQILALPTSTVHRILRVDSQAVSTLEGHQVIRLDDRPVPLMSLANVLEFSEGVREVSKEEKLPTVVLAVADRHVAFQVDQLIRTEVLLMKPLGPQLKRVRNVAGGAILGSGAVVMILNVGDLMKSVETGGGFAVQRSIQVQESLQKRILVADDSVTTRTLEKNILTNSGYQVLVAGDGMEAWTLLQTEHVDAVVSDVDMPVMNGFALAEKVRADERLRHLPFVLVTGKEKPEDRLRGLQAGADVYLTKSGFDQTELLETLERLIG